MVQFTALIKKFGQQGEKTGWIYIEVPEAIALQLKPGNKRSFRVKGMLDRHPVKSVALLPNGGGDFIMALNAAMRKSLSKQPGDLLQVQLEQDTHPPAVPADLLVCLEDEPGASAYFFSLAPSHQLYFSKWIETAKTDTTRTNRIAHTLNALVDRLDYGQMIRRIREEKEKLGG